MVTPKADLAFMLITPDLHAANRIEKQLSLALGPDVLVPVYSYLSLTEESEYRTSPEEYAGILEREQNVQHGTPEFEKSMAAFEERMKHYRHERVYPTLPDWPVVCFYNMSKRRGEQRNWYALPFEDRRKLMLGHGAVGRQYAGKVKQLITGSIRARRCRMGRDAFRARHIPDQSDRLPDAFRSGQRRVRGLRRILHRAATAARRVVPSAPALMLRVTRMGGRVV